MIKQISPMCAEKMLSIRLFYIMKIFGGLGAEPPAKKRVFNEYIQYFYCRKSYRIQCHETENFPLIKGGFLFHMFFKIKKSPLIKGGIKRSSVST